MNCYNKPHSHKLEIIIFCSLNTVHRYEMSRGSDFCSISDDACDALEIQDDKAPIWNESRPWNDSDHKEQNLTYKFVNDEVQHYVAEVYEWKFVVGKYTFNC